MTQHSSRSELLGQCSKLLGHRQQPSMGFLIANESPNWLTHRQDSFPTDMRQHGTQRVRQSGQTCQVRKQKMENDWMNCARWENNGHRGNYKKLNQAIGARNSQILLCMYCILLYLKLISNFYNQYFTHYCTNLNKLILNLPHLSKATSSSKCLSLRAAFLTVMKT